MRFVPTAIDGVTLVALDEQHDERGFFARTFCEDEFGAHGLGARFPQCNLSHNRARGTLRGMHFEPLPSQESKLVRCTVGAVYDVVVDLRPGSPTRLRWVGVELSRANGQALFMPPGCAHGFLTLTDDVDVTYHMGAAYRPGTGRGFRWDDPLVGIEWPFEPVVVSERDQGYAPLDPADVETR